MKALVWDTETSGLIRNGTIKLHEQPSIIEFYGCLVNLNNGKIENELEILIKPPRPISEEKSDLKRKIEKKTIKEITGLTNEMLADKPPFTAVSDKIFTMIESAPLSIAHNHSYDKEMIDIEARRLNRIIRWPPQLCTVEQTVGMKGIRLSLGELYDMLFPGETFVKHRAKSDVLALVRCCVELNKRGYI